MQIRNARNAGIVVAALTSAFALSACGASDTPAQQVGSVATVPNGSAPSGSAPSTGQAATTVSGPSNDAPSDPTIIVIHDNGVDRRGYWLGDGPSRHFVEVGPDYRPGPGGRPDEHPVVGRPDEHPAVVNPAQPAPAAPAPARPEPAKPEPARPEPARPEPAQKAEPAKPAAPAASDVHSDAPAKAGTTHDKP